MSKILRGLIRARGSTPESQIDRPVVGGRDIQIGVVEVKDRLGVAKFKIDASAADFNRGHRSGDGLRAAQQKLKIPRTGAGLDQIDGGAFAEPALAQPQGREFQMPREQRQQANPALEFSHARKGLDPGAGIFVDDDIFQGESGAAEQAEIRLFDRDLAAQAPFERALDSRLEEIGVQVRRANPNRYHQREPDPQSAFH
jgi:hypothetical protein